MGKVVINCCYGGFGISEEAYNWLKEHNIDEELINKCDIGLRYPSFSYYGPRCHPLLIQCVEELREKVNDRFSDLRVAEFEGDLYRINEYDGLESVETPNDIIWNNCNDY